MSAPRRLDLTGQRFDSLVAVAPTGASNRYGREWLCRCDCGGERRATAGQLRAGRFKSCGCLHGRGAHVSGDEWHRAHAGHMARERARWLLVEDGVLPARKWGLHRRKAATP